MRILSLLFLLTLAGCSSIPGFKSPQPMVAPEPIIKTVLHCHHSFAGLDEVVSAAVRDCWSLLEILLLWLRLLPLLRLGLWCLLEILLLRLLS